MSHGFNRAEILEKNDSKKDDRILDIKHSSSHLLQADMKPNSITAEVYEKPRKNHFQSEEGYILRLLQCNFYFIFMTIVSIFGVSLFCFYQSTLMLYIVIYKVEIKVYSIR